MTDTPEDKAFFDLGMQYYVAARSAAIAGLLPVSGILYHDALERFLKAGLSRTVSMDELKGKKYGHNLTKIWNAFKAKFPSAELAQFDVTIRNLDRWEGIRYPEKVLQQGARMSMEWVDNNFQDSIPSEVPIYKLNGADIDRLVIALCEVSSVSPFFYTNRLQGNPHARESLTRYHPIPKQILGE
jgi:hypothetical protein